MSCKHLAHGENCPKSPEISLKKSCDPLTNHKPEITMKSHFSWDFVLAPFQLKNIAVVNSSAKNIVTHETSTSSQREIFSETGTGTSSSDDVSHSDGDIPEEQPQCMGTQSKHREISDSSGTSRTTTSSESEIFSSYNNIYNNSSDCETYTSSQSEITEYDASIVAKQQGNFKTIITWVWQLISKESVLTHTRNGNNS